MKKLNGEVPRPSMDAIRRCKDGCRILEDEGIICSEFSYCGIGFNVGRQHK